MSQTRYYVFRFTSPDGVRTTLCTTEREIWETALDGHPVQGGWSPWMMPWDNTASHGHEPQEQDGRLARVNFDHVLSIEIWSVLR